MVKSVYPNCWCSLRSRGCSYLSAHEEVIRSVHYWILSCSFSKFVNEASENRRYRIERCLLTLCLGMKFNHCAIYLVRDRGPWHLTRFGIALNALSQSSEHLIRRAVLIYSDFPCMLRPFEFGAYEYLCDPGHIPWDRPSQSWPAVQIVLLRLRICVPLNVNNYYFRTRRRNRVLSWISRIRAYILTKKLAARIISAYPNHMILSKPILRLR